MTSSTLYLQTQLPTEKSENKTAIIENVADETASVELDEEQDIEAAEYVQRKIY